MKVRDVMTAGVRTCRPDMTLADAVREMWDGDCGVLPIIGEDGRVAGMITDRDICVAVATRGRTADRIAVREVAGPHAFTCLASDDVSAALETMKRHQVRRLPVVGADGHLRGILSMSDVVTHAGAAPAQDVVSVLAGICEHRGPVVVGSAA